MIVDNNGKPVVSKKREQQNRNSRFRAFLKNKGLLLIGVIGTLSVVVTNLADISDFYEKLTDGPIIEIPIEISNTGAETIQVTSLLDLYITATQFYSGRLIAGESPTDRVVLNTDRSISPYIVKAGETANYSIKIHERRYEHELASGGLEIVFVLHLEDNDKIYYFKEAFHRNVLSSIRLGFTVE